MMSVQLFRHKPIDVIAATFDNLNGTINLDGFPIKLTITPTGEFLCNALLGPMQIFKVGWTDIGIFETTRLVPHNTVFIARRMSNCDGYYLDFEDFDTFFNKYEPIEKVLDKLTGV